MLKKILIPLLALVMMVTFMPTMAFGAMSTQPVKTETTKKLKKAKKGEVKLGKSQIGRFLSDDDVDVELETLKASVRDYINEYWDDSVGDEEDYCDDVLKEMKEQYNSAMQAVENAKSTDDLIAGYFWIFIILSDDIEQPLTNIDTLCSLTKEEVKGKEDLPYLKKQLKKESKEAFEDYDPSDYNDYYKGVLRDKKAEVNELLAKDMTTFVQYAEVENEIENITYNDDDDYYYFDEEDDEEYEEEETFDDLEVDSWIYDNEELAEIRANMGKWGKSYIKEDLRAMGYTGKLQPLYEKLSTFEQNLAKDEILEDMMARYQNFLTDVTKAAGIDKSALESASSGDILRLKKKLKNAYYEYREQNYSESKWKKLKTVYYKYNSKVGNFYLQSQVKDSVVEEMQKEIAKIPTLKQEMKSLRTKYEKKLNVYLNSDKYKTSKTKPLLAKAKKKMAAAEDVTELKSTYKTYKKKLNKYIRTYKVTTKKTGPGTITKSKTVKYGTTYTVKVSPKAGHKIASVKIDGKTQKLKNSYKLKKVKKAHTVQVVFR